MTTVRELGRGLLSVSGEAALLRKFDALIGKHQRAIARKALTAGMRIMRDEEKAQVPNAKTKGHSSAGLKKNIGSKLKRNRKADEYSAVAGIGVGKKRPAKGDDGTAAHYHLVALGTRARWTGHRTRRTRGARTQVKTGKPIAYRGRMPADDFIGRAYAAKGSSVVGKMIDVMRTGIEGAAASG